MSIKVTRGTEKLMGSWVLYTGQNLIETTQLGHSILAFIDMLYRGEL